MSFGGLAIFMICFFSIIALLIFCYSCYSCYYSEPVEEESPYAEISRLYFMTDPKTRSNFNWKCLKESNLSSEEQEIYDNWYNSYKPNKVIMENDNLCKVTNLSSRKLAECKLATGLSSEEQEIYANWYNSTKPNQVKFDEILNLYKQTTNNMDVMNENNLIYDDNTYDYDDNTYDYEFGINGYDEFYC